MFSRFSRSSQPPHQTSLMERNWRDIKWGEDIALKDNLKKVKVMSPDVECLRILVHGPVGAGKSSLINSISSVFQERMVDTAIAEAPTDKSFTKMFNVHQIRDGKTREPLCFVFCDIMGLEKGESEGVHPHDLIKVLKGQIKNGQKMKREGLCSDNETNINSNPTLSDQIHCLLSVISADTLSMMDDQVYEKIRKTRVTASEMGIPQFTILTKVDLACVEVQKDLKMVYRSKRLKEKMQECSNKLGLTMNCIYPVKNYHEEIDLDPDMNMLLLSAMKRILDAANDHVERMAPPPANMRSSEDL